VKCEKSQSGEEKNLAVLASHRRKIFRDLAEKWKKLGRAQIWPRQTDPMKGQLFAKKGVK
jgi:hypothetical protein